MEYPVAKTYFEAYRVFLSTYNINEAEETRKTARSKLARLTVSQFFELSTDVYDELDRRMNNVAGKQYIPYLPSHDDFHPKRNQARQKLSGLPTNRCQDLACDVYLELIRRHPEVREEL